jgi:hypothetical protein
LLHSCPEAQANPQAPQFAASAAKVAHAVPHRASVGAQEHAPTVHAPPPHELAHVPQ